MLGLKRVSSLVLPQFPLFIRRRDGSIPDTYGTVLLVAGTVLSLLVMVQGVAPTRIDVERFMHDTEVSTWWRAAPGQLKVVAIENGAGVVELNPGVVVANVKADLKVYDNECLLIYQSTKELRIAGSGFDDDVEVSPFRVLCWLVDVLLAVGGAYFKGFLQRGGVAHGA